MSALEIWQRGRRSAEEGSVCEFVKLVVLSLICFANEGARAHMLKWELSLHTTIECGDVGIETAQVQGYLQRKARIIGLLLTAEAGIKFLRT